VPCTELFGVSSSSPGQDLALSVSLRNKARLGVCDSFPVQCATKLVSSTIARIMQAPTTRQVEGQTSANERTCFAGRDSSGRALTKLRARACPSAPDNPAALSATVPVLRVRAAFHVLVGRENNIE
jgi:hypothetical protein